MSIWHPFDQSTLTVAIIILYHCPMLMGDSKSLDTDDSGRSPIQGRSPNDAMAELLGGTWRRFDDGPWHLWMQGPI